MKNIFMRLFSLSSAYQKIIANMFNIFLTELCKLAFFTTDNKFHHIEIEFYVK